MLILSSKLKNNKIINNINNMSEYFQKYIKKQYYPINNTPINFKTSFTNCILQSLQKRNYKQTTQDNWNIYWCQKQFIAETLQKTRAQPNQKINHFRNYYQICRKDLLIKNLKKYKKQLQKQEKTQQITNNSNNYNFYPVTYNLPSQYPIFYEEFKKAKEKEKIIWIMKPVGKSQGKGIFLFKNIGQISSWSDIKQAEPYIVQRYIADPLLIGGKKFDMRIYALCLSYQPLIIYLNRSGFGRFTHRRYDNTDINNVEAHLTNVAIQKQSDNYDEQRGGKWLLDKLRLYLMSRYGSQKTDQCFYNIEQIIINTLNSVTKVMFSDKRCFQLYGFDILIDKNLKPWLIQVNGSPSMTANTQIDFDLKCGILDDVFTILDLQKLLTGDQEQVGGFDLIYKGKPIKSSTGNGINFSMLGCYNNRVQQLKKLAKACALRLSQQSKQKAKQQAQKTSKKVWGINNGNPKLQSLKLVDQKHTLNKDKLKTQVKFPQIRKNQSNSTNNNIKTKQNGSKTQIKSNF